MNEFEFGLQLSGFRSYSRCLKKQGLTNEQIYRKLSPLLKKIWDKQVVFEVIDQDNHYQLISESLYFDKNGKIL